ncbi:MAG: HAMP domain-containing sensor histidine kinase [Paracoccaceae bacterium]
MRCRAGLRARLWLGAAVLAALAVAAAAMAVYGLGRTQGYAAESMAAQRRVEAYGALSMRVNEWLLGWLTAEARPDDAPVLGALDTLDRLVAEDVAAAPSATEATQRARQSMTPARLRGHFTQLDAALSRSPPGTEGADAAVAFYAAQAPMAIAAQTEQETRRRDAALAAMEALRRPLSQAAIAVGVAAPLLLLALWLWLFRPLFARLGRATAAAEAMAMGTLPGGAGGHDELGLMFARLRQMSARLDRRRARLARDYDRLEGIVADRTAALSAANDRLARVDSTRRRFFADVGHELRTPLTVIMGEAELGAAAPDPAVRAAFATIQTRAQRLFRRIEDLLRIARSESGQLELVQGPVDLGAAVDAALADLAPLLKRAGVTAGVDLPGLVVRGDADWLRQVFAGFLENAAKYAGRGASVSITGRAEGGRALIQVADTGPGLPPGRVEAVLDRFARDGAAPGFGVGLALARWVVESSGGRLAVLPGPGFRLALDLPLELPLGEER